MGVQAWQNALILVGKYEASAQAKNFQLALSATSLDTTPISTTDNWVTLTGGLKSAQFSCGLMADFADNGQNELINDYFGTADLPKSVAVAATDGSAAYLMRGVTLGYTPVEGTVGELAMASHSAVSSGVVARGLLLHPAATQRTASGTGTAREMGAVSATQRLYAALHVPIVAGTTPSLTVKVQSDDGAGFGSPTDRVTFTAETDGTVGYQWGSVAGAVTDTFWRAIWTISGTNPQFNFAVTAGIF